MFHMTETQEQRLASDIEFINKRGHAVDIKWGYLGDAAKVDFDGMPVAIVYDPDQLLVATSVLYMIVHRMEDCEE